MAYYFAEGGNFQFSTTFGAIKTLTAATNASVAVFTSVAHGFVTGDEVLFKTGWEDATDVIYRVTSLTADTFSVSALNSSNTIFYGAGAGAGTAQKVSGWTDIPQVLTLSPEGGGVRYSSFKPVFRRNGVRQATGFEAAGLTLGLGVDPALPAFNQLKDFARTLEKCAFRQTMLPNMTTYGYGNMSLSEQIKTDGDNPVTVELAISFSGRQVLY